MTETNTSKKYSKQPPKTVLENIAIPEQVKKAIEQFIKIKEALTGREPKWELPKLDEKIKQ